LRNDDEKIIEKGKIEFRNEIFGVVFPIEFGKKRKELSARSICAIYPAA
jgi:hypothetical protein